MATAEDGGATANPTSAGGKFRKKPFRKQSTPYDRPPAGTSSKNWLKKLVVEPASKLISYGADRFFASVIRPRLALLPQPPEATNDEGDGIQGAVHITQDGEHKSTVGEGRTPINSSSSNSTVELEQMLKQKTFTRSEIIYLTELLKSRAVENPSQNNEVPASDSGRRADSGRREQFASGHSGGNINEGIRSSAVISTPNFDSKAYEDDIASPAELAKAYMGAKPSNVSPQVLRMHTQVSRKDTGLLSDVPFASKSPTMSLTNRTSVNLAAQENGFITPRSRGRSALYGMARTPYSRVHPVSHLKGSEIYSNGYAGRSMPSSSGFVVENDEKFESQTTTLKRRSSALDDEAGTVGPIRRTRQKHNLLTPRIHNPAHGVGINSHTKQKLQLMGEPRQKVLKTFGQNDNEHVPSTSYAHVPAKSSEVASRIFQQLENTTPKEKSSESKTVTLREKSSLSLTPNMLHGTALRSMEDMDSSMLQPGLNDDPQLDDRINAVVTDARDSSHRRQGTVRENGTKESVVPSDTRKSVMKNESEVSLKASRSSVGATDSVVANGARQPPQKKRAFRMSAQEDSFEDDGDVQRNGLASEPSFERKRLVQSPPRDSNLPPCEEPRLVKTAVQPEDKLPSGLNSMKSNEFSRGAVVVGERNKFNAFQTSDGTMAASPSAVVTQPTASFDKLKEANNSPPFPSESSKMPESELVISRSLVNPIASTGSEMNIPEVEKGLPLNPLKAGDTSGVSGTSLFAASSGSLVPISPLSASSESASLSITANCVPASTDTSATSIGSIFGSTSKLSSSNVSPFKFGASVDPTPPVSASSTANISEVADQRSKAETGPSSGISSSSHSTLGTSGGPIFRDNTPGLGFSVSTTSSNPQVSLFAGATKSPTFGAGTVSEGTSSAQSVSSAQSGSSALIPSFNTSSNTSFNTNSSAIFGSSFSNSQAFNPNSSAFGFTPSSASAETSTFALGTGTTSSPFKFGASSSSASDGTVVGPSSGAAPGIFPFGTSSSSSSTNAVGSTSSVSTSPIFSFSGSTSVSNTASSFGSGTANAFNFGGSSSSASSTIDSAGTNSTSNNFGTTWQSPASSLSTGFSFGASPVSTNAPMVFNSSTSASSSSFFSFTGASAPVLSSPAQSVFGNNPPSTGFAASPGNGDQMNAEDSMAEDQVQSSAPSVPVFGQPSISPSPPGFPFGSTAPSQANPFAFGSTAPPQANPFMFSGQQNQVAPQNPSSFQASGSLGFNAGGSFSLGSTDDKSGRKIVRISRNSKNRRR